MTEVLINESRLRDVTGKVAIVTGGASGIGKSLVTLLHSRGAITHFCDLNERAGQALVAELGDRVSFSRADVTDWKSLSSFFAGVKAKAGSVNMVFANAGAIQDSVIWEDEMDVDGNLAEPQLLTLDVTLKGVVLTARLAMSYFKKNSLPGGALIFTASSSSYNERPNLPLYSVAKHGVIALMRSLRSIAPAQGVNVACVAPGGTATGMVPPKIREVMERAGIPVQEPEYIALALLILASNQDTNGCSYALLGNKSFEVEDKIKETMPLWYGEYNTDQALRAASVTFAK